MLKFLSSYSKTRILPRRSFSPSRFFQTLLFWFTMSYKIGGLVNTPLKVAKLILTILVLVGWPQPSTHTASPSLSPPRNRTGERIGRAKVRKFIGQDKDSLRREGKRKKPPKRRKGTHHLPQADGCSASLWNCKWLKQRVTQPEKKLPWEVVTLISKNWTSTCKDVFQKDFQEKRISGPYWCIMFYSRWQII